MKPLSHAMLSKHEQEFEQSPDVQRCKAIGD